MDSKNQMELESLKKMARAFRIGIIAMIVCAGVMYYVYGQKIYAIADLVVGALNVPCAIYFSHLYRKKSTENYTGDTEQDR